MSQPLPWQQQPAGHAARKRCIPGITDGPLQPVLQGTAAAAAGADSCQPGQAKSSVQQAATVQAGMGSTAAAVGAGAGAAAGSGEGDEPAKPQEQGGQCQAPGDPTGPQGRQEGGHAPGRVPRVWELLEQQKHSSSSSSLLGPEAAPHAEHLPHQPAGHRSAPGPLAPQPHAAYPARAASVQRSSGAAGRSTYPPSTQHQGGAGAGWGSPYYSDLHGAGGMMRAGPQHMHATGGPAGPASGPQGQQPGWQQPGWRQQAPGWQQPPRPGSAWY